MRVAPFVILPLLLTGCAATAPPDLPTPEQLTRDVDAAPPEVVAAAVDVFADLGVPVDRRDPEAGQIHSREITAQQVWNGAPVVDRLYCGQHWDSGVEIALSNPVTFSLGLIARPSGSGSHVQFVVSGSATAASMTNSGESFACRARAGFAEEVFDALAEAIGEPVS